MVSINSNHGCRRVSLTTLTSVFVRYGERKYFYIEWLPTQIAFDEYFYDGGFKCWRKPSTVLFSSSLKRPWSQIFLKGRQRRTRKSTQPAAPRTQLTSNPTPATQPHLPAPSLQVLHQLAPGCTNFCLHGSIVLDAEGCQAEVLYVCVRLELTPADL